MLYRKHNDGGIDCALEKEEREMVHTALVGFKERTTLTTEEHREMLEELIDGFS